MIRMWALFVLVFSVAEAQSPRSAMDEAAQALGGKDRLLAVKTLTFEGSGIAPNVGQNRTPEAPLPNWNLPEYKKSVDLANGRVRVEQHRVAGFPFALANDVRQVQGLDGDTAYNIVDGKMRLAADATLRDRRLELLDDPISAVRAALDASTKLSTPRAAGSNELVDVTTAKGDSFTLAIDRMTHLPSFIAWTTASDNIGDVRNQTSFLSYERIGGLMLPKHFLTKMDFHDWVTLDIQISRITVDGRVGDLAASAEVKAAKPPSAPPVFAEAQQVAKGIWWIAGSGNHRSVVFEFDDHLTMFEAPASEARTKAAIDKARTLSSKPLTEVIISHHHFDHTGGLRAAIAEGLTIVTHKGNEAFFREIAARKATLRPDLLARNPKPVKLRTLEGELVLKDTSMKDKSMEVDVYQVQNNTHSAYLLMAYVPREKILVQADLYDAGWLRDPWAGNYAKNLELRKLDVAKDVPIHGLIQTRAEELATLAKMQK